MICPKDGHACSCEMRLAGVEPCKPPPPDMAEIERLIDVLGNAAAEEASWTMAIHKAAKYLAARAALMAAIRKTVEKKDA